MVLPAIRDRSRSRFQGRIGLELAVVSAGIEERVDGVEGRIAKRQNVCGKGEIEWRRKPTCEEELEFVATD